LVLTLITMSLISMFGGSSRYFARRSGSLMADFLGAVVREILCLSHLSATSTRLPVLFPTTAPATRLLRVLGEVVQTTAGKWITHPLTRCPNGHTLGPGEVLVGHQACLGPGGGHTTVDVPNLR
jgi:hypothetical protein